MKEHDTMVLERRTKAKTRIAGKPGKGDLIMKTTSKGLTLQILKNSIRVIDTTSTKDSMIFKREFKFIDSKDSKLEALKNAKNWLWNMGNYNGQANEMMDKNNYIWVSHLKISDYK